MGSDGRLVLVVAAALAFDFTNGFHDTANAMATSIATRALKPRLAVALSAVLNFAGAFVSIAVATTVAEGIVNNGEIECGRLMIATLIDTDALLDVVLISFGATVALVVAFGTAVVATDRVDTQRRFGRPAAPWLATLVVAGLASAGIIALGIWAMTQKS